MKNVQLKLQLESSQLQSTLVHAHFVRVCIFPAGIYLHVKVPKKQTCWIAHCVVEGGLWTIINELINELWQADCLFRQVFMYQVKFQTLQESFPSLRNSKSLMYWPLNMHHLHQKVQWENLTSVMEFFGADELLGLRKDGKCGNVHLRMLKNQEGKISNSCQHLMYGEC